MTGSVQPPPAECACGERAAPHCVAELPAPAGGELLCTVGRGAPWGQVGTAERKSMDESERGHLPRRGALSHCSRPAVAVHQCRSAGVPVQWSWVPCAPCCAFFGQCCARWCGGHVGCVCARTLIAHHVQRSAAAHLWRACSLHFILIYGLSGTIHSWLGCAAHRLRISTLVHVWVLAIRGGGSLSPLWAFVAGGNYGFFFKNVWFRGFSASLLRAAVPALQTVIVCQRVPVLRAGL